MENLIIEMEKYRAENITLTDADIDFLNRLSAEINVVMKHSSDHVTFDKHELIQYLNLISQYNRIEGFNTAINFVDAYNKENK